MTKLKLILLGLALAALLGGIATIYYSGKSAQRIQTENVQLKTFKKDVEKNEKVDRQVRRMDIPAIDKSLSHWMRND